ncbi:glycosyltransferase [Subsaximicrobium wynnwilliamsii]|uniref:Glycosyltransferase n=1 Tax=Subsaximicrobium wynnwilliamsii TaxID=291179 RepID=A0A5C6ZBQ6_9FLAO|nr:glycosyltransferase family 2 protein [Subsaximicrobium wynnwilliamsii]TXD81698.1 glycosyltransferase [Subsaximicrobium wynnwilliamsii]TXD87453.1 glycosyltransferase [Subsaximicrobium wynnwilliamsii]TXE01141.1 glycosyltransferase [Subsaximicrobium wynnwilliamsii]
MRISIITINYNNLEGLQKTMRSVLDQTYPDIEYIVIDGGSTDGSKAYIESCQQDLAYWISEPDKGIFHAMNKGIEKTTGEYLLFLNSGDTLYSDSVIVESANRMNDDSDIYYGNVLRHYKHQQPLLKIYPAKLDFSFFIDSALPHQAVFSKRSLFSTIGYFNESYEIASDWELLTCAICKYNCSYRYLDIIISNYDMTGVSSQKSSQIIFKKERRTTYVKYFPAFMNDYERFRYDHKFIKAHKLNKLKSISQSKILIKVHQFVLNLLYLLSKKANF